MRDAFGGIVNISFIVVFMVIVNGYLAFAANYNKAFRYKNKIINIIEQNEGYDEKALKKIEAYRLSIGYSLSKDIKPDIPKDCNQTDVICGTQICPTGQGFCVVQATQGKTNELSKKFYTVTTAVNIDIPILNKFLTEMKIFQVNGTTKTITKH